MVLIDGWYSESVTPRIRTGSANSTHTEDSDDVMPRVAGRGPHTACRDFFRTCEAPAASTPRDWHPAADSSEHRMHTGSVRSRAGTLPSRLSVVTALTAVCRSGRRGDTGDAPPEVVGAFPPRRVVGRQPGSVSRSRGAATAVRGQRSLSGSVWPVGGDSVLAE